MAALLKVYYDADREPHDDIQQEATNIAQVPMLKACHIYKADAIEMLFSFRTDDALQEAKSGLRDAGFRFFP